MLDRYKISYNTIQVMLCLWQKHLAIAVNTCQLDKQTACKIKGNLFLATV